MTQKILSTLGFVLPHLDPERRPGGRAQVAFSVFIGNHFIAADHGPHSRADVRELTLRRLLA